MSKRVKVKLEHKRKLFYQKYLETCRENSDDRHQQFTYYKAIQGLRTYPLEVNGINDLKQINGETIATRCAAAWDQICSDRQKELTLAEIKQFTKEDYTRLMLTSRNTKKKPQSPKKNKQASGSNEFEEPGKKKNRNIGYGGDSLQTNLTGGDKNEFDERFDEEERLSASRSQIPHVASLSSQQSSNCLDKNMLDSEELDEEESSLKDSYMVCKPYDQAEVILICDTREDRKKKHGYNVVEVLSKNNSIRFETRVLSVGDFLWVARKIDGSEMVLDWIIERKTWDDLESSIRHGRYDEQKQRLRRTPMNNRVYLLEDRGRGPVGAEQALATTRSRDCFLIQRCKDGRETAMFLEAVTRRLVAKIRKQTLTGISFKYLQGMSEKGQIATVKNIWVEQLTVCPGMSSSRAQAVVEYFPSIASLANHVNEAGKDGDNSEEIVSKVLPQVPKSVSARLCKVFVN